MRRVAKPASPPADFVEKSARELASATGYFGPPRTSPDGFPFAVYKSSEVKLALEQLFRGKCAYCETFYANAHPMDVEHFRPKGAVAGEQGHSGYWWIAMAWENLLPSCIDCNRKRNQITPTGDVSQIVLLETTLGYSSAATAATGKKDSFPLADGGSRATKPGDVLDNERALLLNPCEEEPDDHLGYFFSADHPVSFVVPQRLPPTDPGYLRGAGNLSLKGGTSIHVYGLNRVGLVQARTEILRRLEFLGTMVIDLKVFADEIADGFLPSASAAVLQQSDTAMRQRAHAVVNGFANRILEEITRMADPGAPYSAMVKSWLRHFADRVESAS